MQMFPAALWKRFYGGVGTRFWLYDPVMWGLIFFLPRVLSKKMGKKKAFDAISDPIMGFISDNTRSRRLWRRQYIYVGAILMGITFIHVATLSRKP